MLNMCRSLVVVLALGGAVAACAGDGSRESTGQYIDSATITAKVKSALVQDPQTSALQVNVETFRDTVQLSGFVESQAMKSRAEQVARNVEGVRAVRNDLIVRPKQ
ncbi:MAG TPA: BON domain-containing protein [Ferrovibrio sp.]|jgi:hyperosmotically inducible protein|uniref:BON domain-containing protein n=1 Tax=Ferrovibrio sp. TaxID=1917215 RepID=UPI002B4B0475|nr:BON domain-containing protein [Ferrovibrio sp.]HLT78948.1 BON domain-containing protein [Ferrovibrio sp.]